MTWNEYFEAESAPKPARPLLCFIAGETVEKRRDAVVLEER